MFRNRGSGISFNYTDQVVDFVIVCEERFALPVLVSDESLNVEVEALAGRTIRGLGGHLTLLKEQS